MRAPQKLIAALAMLLAPVASRAVNVPLPIEGATMNIIPAIQTQMMFTASRSIGLQLRGWAMDKKIGFRGGVFEGQRASATSTLVNARSTPLFAGFAQYNILGTQEGAFIYQSIYFSKEPLLSVGVGAS